eukprot:gnl/TRDRNA2_/TRDRNA2_137116_c0_seq1.p1 gnl/TRDRNA2_/TRDRNA2_137116_c0~~gnl/TRDRNA2_/TRDRNA2_137116_c0_seq1.p1  ORF type:complete len:133 (-),score=8.90 gnl/TRDRNA2_/TRDRNA2_137116_c0_seq1:147-545(-)
MNSYVQEAAKIVTLEAQAFDDQSERTHEGFDPIADPIIQCPVECLDQMKTYYGSSEPCIELKSKGSSTPAFYIMPSRVDHHNGISLHGTAGEETTLANAVEIQIAGDADDWWSADPSYHKRVLALRFLHPAT